MQRILPGFGIGQRYLADFADTVAPALSLVQALATSAWTFLPPARISTTDFGPRGICLLRSMILPSSVLTPTTALPPFMMVQSRIDSPLKIPRTRSRRKLLRPASTVKRDAFF